MTRRLLSVWFLIVLLLLSACQELPGRDAPSRLEAQEEAAPLQSAGFIEAEEIRLAARVGGRVVQLPVDIGDEVEAGVVVAHLDERIAAAEVRMAEAQVAEAEARLAMARNGATESAIAKAVAQFDQAEAGAIGACQAWEDAQAVLASPQELDRQIAVTRAQVRAAEAGYIAASALKDAAEIGVAQFEDARETLSDLPDKVAVYEGGLSDVPLDVPDDVLDFLDENPPPEGTYRFGDNEIVLRDSQVTIYRYITESLPVGAHFVPNQYWQAWVGVNSAHAAYQGLERVLGLLYQMRANPTQLQARVDEAGSLCLQAQAQADMAEAQLDALRAGTQQEEIAVLDAQLMQARSELEQKELVLDRYTLRAPTGGLVLERPLKEGELAGPEATVLILGDLDVVYLTLYLPAVDLARVAVGQSVTVRLDSLPNRTFEGEVVTIGQEAEFPPQSVPQPDDRASLVFAVRLRIPNPDHVLKPGTYAEATFEEVAP